MDVSSQVAEMAGQLAQAVNTTMDPTVPHAVRLASYNLLEKVMYEADFYVLVNNIVFQRRYFFDCVG